MGFLRAFFFDYLLNKLFNKSVSISFNSTKKILKNVNKTQNFIKISYSSEMKKLENRVHPILYFPEDQSENHTFKSMISDNLRF